MTLSFIAVLDLAAGVCTGRSLDCAPPLGLSRCMGEAAGSGACLTIPHRVLITAPTAALLIRAISSLNCSNTPLTIPCGGGGGADGSLDEEGEHPGLAYAAVGPAAEAGESGVEKAAEGLLPLRLPSK